MSDSWSRVRNRHEASRLTAHWRYTEIQTERGRGEGKEDRDGMKERERERESVDQYRLSPYPAVTLLVPGWTEW